MAVFYAINAVGLLRVTAEGETYGLDLHEHGISAYPEYVISSIGRPNGMAAESMTSAAADPLPQALGKPATS